jgi:hypothetical protein
MTSGDCMLNRGEETMQHIGRTILCWLQSTRASGLLSEVIHPGKAKIEQEEISEVLSTLRRLRLM